MPFKRLRKLIAPLLVSLPLLAQAGPFSTMYVFGDSLSDPGNLAILAGGGNLPPLPCATGFCGPYYLNQQLSNGPVWTQTLAAGLGLPFIQSQSFAVGGNNFAFAGARTGHELDPAFPPGVFDQAIGIFGQGGTLAAVDPNALYVVVGGGNDMRASRFANTGVTLADQIAHAADAFTAVNNLATTIGYLASLGAKNFLISTLPDLGLTPEAALYGLQAASTDAAYKFNALIGPLMGFEQSQGLNMALLDMAGLIQDLVTNPGAFGITNTDKPCAGFTYSAGDSCATSVFSDVLHPSAYTHTLIARAALEALGVPEPDSLALFALALLAVVVTSRRAASAGRRQAVAV